MSDTILNIAGHGMSASETQYEALVNNLVNTRTNGYKTVGAIVRSFPEYLADVENSQSSAGDFVYSGTGPMYPRVTSITADLSQGSTIVTNRNLDFAIEGEGLFSMQTAWGTAFSRDGRFLINSQGILVTSIGNYPVLGEKGPIMVPPGVKLTVMPNGQILADDNPIDKINVTAFEKPGELEVAGGNFLRMPVDKNLEIKKDPVFKLQQGVLEMSNVKVVEEMMKMITFQKSHEANVNMAKARDTLLQRLIEMGAPVK